MTRPTKSIKWLDMMASKSKAKCPEELLDVLAARQLLAYINELEERNLGVIITARGCGKTQMVQLALDQHLKRAAQDI